MSRFIRDEGYSRKKNSLNGYFQRETGSGAKGDAIPGASRLRNQNEILIEKSDEAKRFTRRVAIQLKAKFALANLMRSKIRSHHLNYLIRDKITITLPILNQAIEFEGESA